ncbi:hypothetical protein [Staphylococcus pettenkoferi]|nr:hypothetical protein [Staphylococcus pettenkoferi]
MKGEIGIVDGLGRKYGLNGEDGKDVKGGEVEDMIENKLILDGS